MKFCIYVLNIAVLFSVFLDLRTKEAERRLSFGILRILFMLPLLAGCYFFTFSITDYYVIPFFYNSENVFSLLWMALAYRLHTVTFSKLKIPTPFWLLLAGGSVVVAAAVYGDLKPSVSNIIDGGLIFPHYGIIYCSSFFLLASVLFLGWRLEAFWRSLDSEDKWRYKYLVISLFLVCALLGWSASYRLTYLRMPRNHFLLMSIVLMAAWMGMVYALARHRLLNRKFFISRKVVYASITPIAFSGFFIIIGIMSLLTRLYGWPVPFVLQWVIIILGLLAIIVLALSGSVRKRVKYFVSTHFYVNKYEYRDEWLAFSHLLQGNLSENGVGEALYQILRDSLYTHTILIWLGDTQKGFRLMQAQDDQDLKQFDIIAGDDPMICYLHNAPYFYRKESGNDPLQRSVSIEKEAFLRAHDIVLMVPLIMGNHCVGLVGLGAETTGGSYGHDDFDLLAALSSHAASALLAVQNAEKLAQSREQSAWNNMSAFVLHDIKNAATMLELVRKNAPQYMDNPEFRQDMLESIDDALKRMGKVQTRLSALKGEMVPAIRPINMEDLIGSCCDRLAKKLTDLDISVKCQPGLITHSDPDLLYQILENLLINAREAGGVGTSVQIEVIANSMLWIVLQDNGPGIRPDLLPRALFAPFKTSKPNGSGIGLWQVRQLVESLRGDIHAQNTPEGGARFTIQFPYRSEFRPMEKNSGAANLN